MVIYEGLKNTLLGILRYWIFLPESWLIYQSAAFSSHEVLYLKLEMYVY
jgi:hypothetical protein